MRKMKSKKRILAIGVSAALLMLALSGCASQEAEAPEAPQEAGETQETVTIEESASAGDVAITVNSEEWSATSTPVIFHFVSEESNVDFYHAMPFEDNGETISMIEGQYNCGVTVPINANGTTFERFSKVAFVVQPGIVAQGVVNLKPLNDTKLTVEQLDAYMDEVRAAAEMGDDSFTPELMESIENTINSIKATL